MCSAALEEWEMGWARDADGMRRPRIDGCLSPSTIEGWQWRWRCRRSSSVSTERGLDVRFRPIEFFFTGFFVVAEIQHLQLPAISGTSARENRRFVFPIIYVEKIDLNEKREREREKDLIEYQYYDKLIYNVEKNVKKFFIFARKLFLCKLYRISVIFKIDLVASSNIVWDINIHN